MTEVRIAHKTIQNRPFWVTVDRRDITPACGLQAWVKARYPGHYILESRIK